MAECRRNKLRGRFGRPASRAVRFSSLQAATVTQATHHGFYNDFSGAPTLYDAVKPQVVVVNNGARKGLQPSAWETIAAIPGIEGIWQLHFAVASDKAPKHLRAEDRQQ
ncbi:MAG TPA: hypothetical protein VFC21_01265 [Bryobacteraceae bacterium]|nr:hypothetical protein [Bryobacteraceae bacterium]